MGVTLEWRPAKGGKWRHIKAGWRSMLHGILLEQNLFGDLDASDIDDLRMVAAIQCRGQREPPFDWSQDIADSIYEIIKGIESHGAVSVRALW